MSALNYRNQIILDEDNYSAWRERTCLILRAERVLACVLRAPSRLGREWAPEQAAAKEQRARQILRLLVGARLWATASRRRQCARDIWLELERRHARQVRDKFNQQVSELLLQLAAYKMASSRAPNVVHASLELVDIFDKLKALGSPLSDADKIKCIIRALPSHYQEPLSAYLAHQLPCACFNLKSLQQLIVMISQVAQAEARAADKGGPETSVIKLRVSSGPPELAADVHQPPAIGQPDERSASSLAAICCQTPADATQQQQQQQQQQETKFCQDPADPITPPEEQLGVIVHSETIQSPDHWSPANHNNASPTPAEAAKLSCCPPGRPCDPRLHRLKEKAQFKPQLKKREYKIPHLAKQASPPPPPPANSDDQGKRLRKAGDEEDDEHLLGRIETATDGHKFKRVKFIFSENHRLNIVNDQSILHKFEPITPFYILMKDNTTVKAKHRGYVRSESGSFSVFFVPTSDSNYLSIKAMNSKFYLPPKAGEQDYSDMRIRDMVKFNRLKDSAKIILKVNLPSQRAHHHHHKGPLTLKRHYKQPHHHHQKHHKQFHGRNSQSRSPSASPEPRDNSNSSDTSQDQNQNQNRPGQGCARTDLQDSGRASDDNRLSAEENNRSRIDWVLDVEDDDDDDNEPGLAYDLATSMERNKLLSPSFK